MKDKWNQYFFGEPTEEEKRELFQELEKNEDMKREFAEMQNIVGLSGLLPREDDSLKGERNLEAMMNRQEKKLRRKRVLQIVRYTTSAAAMIALTWMLAWYMFVGSETPSYTEITVPKGQRVHLTLPDGSEAWLSSLSTLKWPSVFSSDARTVELDGEGFFTVTKDASRPFTVQTQKYDVRVLGTEFNVYAYSNSEKFETDLLSGKVRVSSTGFPEESVNLLPDEKVSLVDGKLVKSSSHFGGKEYREQGIYDFEELPLGEVLERLEQWYDIHFTVDDPSLLSKIISGKFRQSDQIETILKAISRADLFEYKILSQREITIY